MLDAAVLPVDLHGKETAGALLPIFEDFLNNAPSDQRFDNVRQSVVILMGSLAKHLVKVMREHVANGPVIVYTKYSFLGN